MSRGHSALPAFAVTRHLIVDVVNGAVKDALVFQVVLSGSRSPVCCKRLNAGMSRVHVSWTADREVF